MRTQRMVDLYDSNAAPTWTVAQHMDDVMNAVEEELRRVRPGISDERIDDALTGLQLHMGLYTGRLSAAWYVQRYLRRREA